MKYAGPERREYVRIAGKFVVSYRVKDDADNVDITQTRNISLGGMVLTTNRNFPKGTFLTLDIRLPFFVGTISIIGRVQDTREIVKDLIYDTHIKFITVDPKSESIIKETVGYYLKDKEGKE